MDSRFAIGIHQHFAAGTVSQRGGSAKKDEMLFSIILAGYKTAPYLPKALDSVKAQTFRDFEAICYVEESPDDSLAICRAAAEKDPRFIVVSAPKSGAVASTRNYGIEHASGEYLVVLDGDDWIVPDMLEKLARKIAETGGADVLSFAAVTTESEIADIEHAPRLTNFRRSDEKGVFSGFDAIRRAGRNGGRMCNHTVLSIYRTEFLREHHIRQTPGRLMEDFESTPRIWFYAKRFAYLDEVFYVYRRRPGSLTTEASSRIALDIVRQFKSLLIFAEDHEIPEDILAVWSNQWLSILYWFLFHPVTSGKLADPERRQALAELFADGGGARFCRLCARASLPKRVAAMLTAWAAKGLLLPAKFYFRHLYYPLIEHKHKKNA